MGPPATPSFAMCPLPLPLCYDSLFSHMPPLCYDSLFSHEPPSAMTPYSPMSPLCSPYSPMRPPSAMTPSFPMHPLWYDSLFSHKLLSLVQIPLLLRTPPSAMTPSSLLPWVPSLLWLPLLFSHEFPLCYESLFSHASPSAMTPSSPMNSPLCYDSLFSSSMSSLSAMNLSSPMLPPLLWLPLLPWTPLSAMTPSSLLSPSRLWLPLLPWTSSLIWIALLPWAPICYESIFSLEPSLSAMNPTMQYCCGLVSDQSAHILTLLSKCWSTQVERILQIFLIARFTIWRNGYASCCGRYRIE